MTLAIGFGANAAGARAAASRSLATGFASGRGRASTGWRAYRGLAEAPARERARRRAAAARLRAVGARPGRVRGQDLPRRVDRVAEHAVDLGHARRSRRTTASPARTTSSGRATSTTSPPRRRRRATTAAADRLLDYLWRVQKPDGSWWQNTRVDGREKWTTEQLDQVSLPIVLAWWLGRTSASDWAHVEQAADYLVSQRAAACDQERWENQNGYSPNTIATEIAGLICAADIARRNGRRRRRRRYEALADDWQQRVESWTATTQRPVLAQAVLPARDQGRHAGQRHDLQPGRQLRPTSRPARDRGQLVPRPGPLRRQEVERPDGAQLADRRRPDERLPAGVDTPSGPVWHRFTYDGYGEQADGRDWDLFFDNPARQTRGRLWPLLTGERGEYELIAGRSARPFLRTIANTANDGLMLPEQVWDDAAAAGRAVRQGHALGDAAGVDAWPVRPARVVDRRRRADRAPVDRRLPLPEGALPLTRIR